MASFKSDSTPPSHSLIEARLKSISPIRDTNERSPEQQMNTLFNQLSKKDREIESLRVENAKLKDQHKEYEYLIIKASDEVKKKHQEIQDMKSLIDSFKNNTVDLSRVSELQTQLIDAKAQLKNFESHSNQSLIQARVDIQKEKELNHTLHQRIQDLKEEVEKLKKEAKLGADEI